MTEDMHPTKGGHDKGCEGNFLKMMEVMLGMIAVAVYFVFIQVTSWL